MLSFCLCFELLQESYYQGDVDYAYARYEASQPSRRSVVLPHYEEKKLFFST